MQSCHSRIKAFKLAENIHKEKKIKRYSLHFQTFLKVGFDVKNDCIPTRALRGNGGIPLLKGCIKNKAMTRTASNQSQGLP